MFRSWWYRNRQKCRPSRHTRRNMWLQTESLEYRIVPSQGNAFAHFYGDIADSGHDGLLSQVTGRAFRLTSGKVLLGLPWSATASSQLDTGRISLLGQGGAHVKVLRRSLNTPPSTASFLLARVTAGNFVIN